MSDKTVVLVTHSKTAAPGAVAEALQRHGYDSQICCPLLGDSLPPLASGRPVGFAASVVFGGPMGVDDVVAYPFLREETAWLRAQMEAGAPVFGICLGAQLMARAVGAKVSPHSGGLREIGYYPVSPAPAGGALFPAPMHAYQWHRDGFELPDGAVLLAEGEAFPHQAFRYGEAAYGVQFHPEMTPAIMERWITSEKGAPQLSFPGAQSAAAQRASAAGHNGTMRGWLERFLRHWLGPA